MKKTKTKSECKRKYWEIHTITMETSVFFVIFKRKYTLLLHTSTFQRKYIRNKWITLKLSSLFSESVSILLRFLCLFFVSFLYLHIYRIISLLFFNFCSVVFSTTMSYSQSFTVQTSNTVSFMAHNDLFFLDSSENTGKYIVLFPIKSNNFISFFFLYRLTWFVSQVDSQPNIKRRK